MFGGEGGLGGVSGGGGRGRWMDRQTRPSQLAPWGHTNALMYKLCPWQAGGEGGWAGRVGGGVDGWTDEQAQASWTLRA